jgi:hypothetical protein
MRDVARQKQLRLFGELVETVVTRDRVTDDAVLIRRPPGRCWLVADAHRERHTKWQRRKPIILPRRRQC